MNRRKRNFGRPGFVFIILLIISLALVAAGAFAGLSSGRGGIFSVLMAPMQNGINSIGRFTSTLSSKRKSIASLESENDVLSAQVEELKSRISSLEQNLSDYEDILALTELKEKYPAYDMVGARIIGKDPGNWFNNFTINKGSRDGIKVDMNVVANQGLVGIVTAVGPTSSTVKSIIDDTSSVSAMISKNYNNCVVEGNLTLLSQGLLKVDMIADKTSVVDGDEVVTSYISDRYLPGILIGYISDVQADDANLSYYAKLTPVADFQHLQTVMVIKQLKSDMDQGQLEIFQQEPETIEESHINETNASAPGDEDQETEIVSENSGED